MKKSILCLLAAALLVFAANTGVSAEEFTGYTGWKVEFDGEKMNSNFKSSEMTDEIYQIQPGDTIRLQVGVENVSGGTSDWYMENEILKSLEETQSVAEGGAYTYILAYQDSKGKETVLFSSESVGGEGEAGVEVGLNQATNSLRDYFFLDRLDAGGKGTVYLTVGLDGETQGNTYQDTLAQLRMSFAAESTSSTLSQEDSGGSTSMSPGTPIDRSGDRNLPKTGDETNFLPYYMAAFVSGIVLLVLGILAFRQKKEEEEQAV